MGALGPADPVRVGPTAWWAGWGGRDGPGLPWPIAGRPSGRGEDGAPEYAADLRFRKRFAAEIEAARRVGGFYTAQVVDADPDDSPPWLVTAYVADPSLQTAVREYGRFRRRPYGPLGRNSSRG